MIILRWKNCEAAGSRDFLAPSLFDKEGNHGFISHETIWPGSAVVEAKAALKVDGKLATLDYGGDAESWNKAHDVYIDQIRLTFSDDSRAELVKVEWLVDEIYEDAPVDFWDTAAIHATEGDLRLISHFRRERDDSLRRQKLQSVSEPKCEVCGRDYIDEYGEHAPTFEIHHREVLAKGQRETLLLDLAILCSNCHRAIHKTDPLMDVPEFAALYERKVPSA